MIHSFGRFQWLDYTPEPGSGQQGVSRKRPCAASDFHHINVSFRADSSGAETQQNQSPVVRNGSQQNRANPGRYGIPGGKRVVKRPHRRRRYARRWWHLWSPGRCSANSCTLWVRVPGSDHWISASAAVMAADAIDMAAIMWGIMQTEVWWRGCRHPLVILLRDGLPSVTREIER